VGEDLGPRIEHLVQERGVAIEVRREEFDAGARVDGVDLTDRLGRRT